MERSVIPDMENPIRNQIDDLDMCKALFVACKNLILIITANVGLDFYA